MADQPQNPNAGRINSMLTDLSARRAQGQVNAAGRSAPAVPPNIPTRPVAPIPGRPVGGPPGQLPTRPISPAPMPAAPVAPLRPKTVIPQSVQGITAPTPDQAPSVAPMPRPSMPPPPPREVSVPATPPPPRPVVPPAPPAAAVAPQPISTPQAAQPYSSELRTMSADISRVSTGQAPAGIRPPAPTAQRPVPTPSTPVTGVTVVPPIVAPTSPVIIVTPPASSGGGTGMGRKIIYGLMGLGLLAALWWAASIFLGSSPAAQVTPSPSVSVAATLPPTTEKTTSTYFRQTGTVLTLNADGTATQDFANAIATAQPTGKQALRIPISGPFSANFSDFIGAIDGEVPAPLKMSLGKDWAVLAYGQTEQYDGSGNLVSDAPVQSRLVLVEEVTDVSAANAALTAWETVGMASIAYDSSGVQSKAIVSGFSDGSYRQIPVRYWNFPYADTSVDWAILTASNNKNYLVISASRESMFFAIDQLMQ